MKRHLRRVGATVIPIFLGLLIIVGWTCLAGPGSAWGEKVQKGPAPRLKAAVEKKTAEKKAAGVHRVAAVVGLNRETAEKYKLLHAHVWPEVLRRLRQSNIRNYSIYLSELDDGNLYLFSYLEYVGEDFEADMKAVADDPATQEWWKLTDPLQKRVKGTPKGDQWKTIQEVFHVD